MTIVAGHTFHQLRDGWVLLGLYEFGAGEVCQTNYDFVGVGVLLGSI